MRDQRVAVNRLIAVICLAVSCAKVSYTDAWYSPLNENPGIAWEEISRNDYFVPDSEISKLWIDRLNDQSFLALTQEDLKSMRVNESVFPKGKNPFLVRGLSYNVKFGEFSVYKRNGDIVIENSSLGKNDRPMVKQPIVVYLDFVPKKIYVNCAMDE